MNTSIVRKEIHDYVEEADGSFLSRVHKMIQTEKENTSTSEQDMVARAEESEQAISEKEVKTFEHFNKDFEQWKTNKRASMK